jgi:phosphoribosylformylglycinamidine synthase I
MSFRPEICILKTDGINCDAEMSYAFETAGGDPHLVHVNQIRSGEKKLADYSGLGLPGGFSYGDDVASGAILANELTAFLGNELQEFIDAKKPVLGVCNGFQVLARTGLLPDRSIGRQKATLAQNDVGRFVCKWTELAVQDNVCIFAPQDGFENTIIPMQIAHGEGRFVAAPDVIGNIKSGKQVVFKYAENPNGSLEDIAGICDPIGLVLGMMPHPERSMANFHPDRIRTRDARGAASIIFNNLVNYTKES